MKFENNAERKEYLKTRGKIILNACPGSGKTTTIAYKLSKLITECNSDYGLFSGISCLSFTNVAKDEINDKYKEFTGKFLGFPNSVSTIDSFIYKYITKPFIHLIDADYLKLQIIDESKVIDDILRSNYQLIRRHSKLLFRYKPSSVEYRIDGTCYSTIGGDNSQGFINYCKEVKTQQLAVGFLKSSDSEYFALQILNKFPRIGEWLIKRFPFIIIDEAQDTSEIQHAIFDKLVELGLKNIEFVGDPYQSLYEFRDARPDLFYSKYKDEENWNCLDLINCRRSSQTIINTYQKLRLNTEKPVLSTAIVKEEKKINVLRYDVGDEIKCVQKYLEVTKEYDNCQVVVRGKSMQKLLTGMGEGSKSPWKNSIPYYLIRAVNFYRKNEIKTAVNILRVVIPEIENPKINKLESKIRLLQLKGDYKYNALIMKLLMGLPNFDNTLEDWTLQCEDYIAKIFKLDVGLNFGLKKAIWIKSYKETINDLFEFRDRKLPVTVSTIHQVKGKTFDSVLMMLSPTSQGQNISLTDYSIPAEFPNEKKRMIYVAMSRPIELLAIGIPNSKHTDVEIKEILGEEVDFIHC